MQGEMRLHYITLFSCFSLSVFRPLLGKARFLAGFATTGEIPDEEEKQTSSSKSALLVAALANLKRCAFVGIMERFEDSMLLLKVRFL